MSKLPSFRELLEKIESVNQMVSDKNPQDIEPGDMVKVNGTSWTVKTVTRVPDTETNDVIVFGLHRKILGHPTDSSTSVKVPRISENIDESIEQLDELFGGTMGAITRKVANAVNRTQRGAGARDLETKAKNLFNAWENFLGSSGGLSNKATIENWIKNKLGVKNNDIWAQAIEEYKEEYPKSGQKYANNQELDRNEILNFFVKFIQVRNATIVASGNKDENPQAPKGNKVYQSPNQKYKINPAPQTAATNPNTAPAGTTPQQP